MQPWLETTIKVFMSLSMLIGQLGLIVPVFPGHTVLLGIALIYGLIFGFGTRGIVFSIILAVLAIIGGLVDNVVMGANARAKGARWVSILVALVAGFVGSILLTPIGGIFCALLGLFVAEYVARKDHKEALEVTKSMAIGWGWAFVIRFAIGLVMIILWGIWAWA